MTPTLTNKGVVFINGYLGATGYTFSSPDHFDVNDVLPSQVPLLDQVADLYGYEVAFYDTDLSLPRQYWSLTYDGLTAPGLPNYIANVPPAIVDSDVQQSHTITPAQPGKPGQAAGDRGHGYFQLGRLRQSASAERRDRVSVRQ